MPTMAHGRIGDCWEGGEEAIGTGCDGLVPTALAFLGLEQPAEMTGSTLLVENVPEL